MPKRQPWSRADATIELNRLGAEPDLDLHLTGHARERLTERNLTTRDILHVLKRGFVYAAPEPATRDFFRYKIQSLSPNSDGRELAVVAIPDLRRCSVKIVTIMYVDE